MDVLQNLQNTYHQNSYNPTSPTAYTLCPSLKIYPQIFLQILDNPQNFISLKQSHPMAWSHMLQKSYSPFQIICSCRI